jgi:hypothetical protein
MCLPNFVEFKQIKKADAVIGYRNWLLNFKDENSFLKSTNQDFTWDKPQSVGNNKVTEANSGIYSHNYCNNHYNYYYNYYYYYYYYLIGGIIKQWGKVAIYQIGYRSQYACIDTLFTIRKSDAQGSQNFLDWIDKFNMKIEKLAKFYKAKTIHYQDFVEKK